MLNIFNMELTRLLKSKCTYIILVLTFLISMLNPAMFKLLEIVEEQFVNDVSYSEEAEDIEISAEDEEIMQETEAMEEDSSFFGEMEWKCTDMTEANITGCNILLLITIFAVIFINGELKNGFIKNLTGYAFKRSKLVIANMIIVAIYTIISLLLCFASTSLATLVLFSNSSMGDFGEFAKVFGVQILLHLGFAFFVSSLTYFVRSSVMPMIVGISLASGMGALIYQLLSLAVNKIFDPEKNFELTKYTLSGNVLTTVSKGNDITLTTGGASSDDLIRAVIVAVICGTAALIVGCMVTEKKDIK
ncbi:MAG: ABC transporter permease [Ruminococcus sp.]|nr:ABC transporter permease [Ruminococcus sp.]